MVRFTWRSRELICLSRLPIDGLDEIKKEEDKEDCFVASVDLPTCKAFSEADWKKAESEDEVLAKVRECVTNGWPKKKNLTCVKKKKESEIVVLKVNLNGTYRILTPNPGALEMRVNAETAAAVGGAGTSRGVAPLHLYTYLE
ncbi:hypothetical protein NDU88_003307 [Pleurodeles waltl]|uniref:Uncharacterized protein n=1 Tax=Pleurodeles waltl TaxID=8319 RepID=A0AAV7T5R9_PLEWA|nr:hypothetical protein NDU88_003307 [Pleurodeles waltl]